MGAGVSGSEKVGTGRRHHRPMSDINVTPLVDVMLVLLIIFMVAAQDEGKDAKVMLPMAEADTDASIEQDTLNASLAEVKMKDGSTQVMVMFNGHDLSVDSPTYDEDLRKLVSPFRGGVMNLNADRNLPCEHVVRTLATVREGGIKAVRIAVEVAPN
jgi:biopolymer transport protein TolR